MTNAPQEQPDDYKKQYRAMHPEQAQQFHADDQVTTATSSDSNQVKPVKNAPEQPDSQCFFCQTNVAHTEQEHERSLEPDSQAGDEQRPAEALRQQIDSLRAKYYLRCIELQSYDSFSALASNAEHFMDEIMELVTAYAATVEREAAIKAVKHLVDHYKANASYGYSDSGEWLVDAEEYLEELQSNENT